MRWLTTILLLVFAVGAGMWLWKGDAIAPLWKPPTAPVGTSESAKALKESVRLDRVQKIELTSTAGTLVLQKAAAGTWTQPGNWPGRQLEATQLATALSNLQPRFQPIAADGDLKAYGLDATQKPTTAKIEVDGQTTTLTIGQPSETAGEPPFARPTYVRINSQAEIVRFDSDLMQIVSRPPDSYRRRQLFPEADRVKIIGGEPATPATGGGRAAILGDAFRSVKVTGPDGAFQIQRTAKTPEPKSESDQPGAEKTLAVNALASAWEIESLAGKPIRDRIDPTKLRAILSGVPELWVEQFLPAKPPAETGLDKPERKVEIVRTSGTTTVLKIGKESRRITKIEPPAAPPMFGQPPQQPRILSEVFHYASLDGLDLLFEVKADKFPELFAKPDDVRDPSLARFEAATVTEFTIAMKGKPAIQLLKKKGNKDAVKDDDKQDRWYVGDILAETTKVTELLDSLAKWEAKPAPAKIEPEGPLTPLKPDTAEKAIVDNADAKTLTDLAIDAAAGSKITVVTQEKTIEGQPATAARTFTYILGKRDVDKKKLAVQVVGWSRINLIADDAFALIDRPALAYRGRRLFDTAEVQLTTVTLVQPASDAFTIRQDANAKSWKLTQPITSEADEVKASQIADVLSRLEATEYVDDAPKDEDLDKKYGLKTPKVVATLGFTGGKVQTLAVGNSPELKPEYYARLNGTGSVFTIAKTNIDTLKQGAVTLLPLQLWSVQLEMITALEIRRGGLVDMYKFSKDGINWKLSGPFDAPVSYLTAQPLLTAIATVKAEKYESLTATDAAKFGFDKPSLRISVSYKDVTPGDVSPMPKETLVTKTILVGKPTADGATTRFAKLEGSPTAAVFALADPLFKAADKPALEWLDKTLLFLDAAQLTKIQIVGPTADGNTTLTKDDKAGWKADGQTFPVDRPSADMLANIFARLPVQSIAGYGANVKWADFGLEKPEYTLTGTFVAVPGDAAKPAVRTVAIGKAAPTGGRYVRVDGGLAVGVLIPNVTDALLRTKLDFVDRSMLQFDPTTLTSIVRKAGTEELELKLGANDKWEIEKPAKLAADKPLLDELADQLSRLRATKVAAYAAKDLKPFGLDTPAAIFTLKVGIEKPEDKIVKIGKPVDDKQPDGDRYAMLDTKGDVTVSVLSAAIAKRLLSAPIKFRDRTLAKFIDADKAILERGDRKVTFAKVDGAWKMVEPLATEAEQGDLDELINALAKLRADELEVDKPKDLKPYGLDKPEAKWVFRSGDKEVLSLLVGAKDKAGTRVFAKLEKGDMVALLDPILTAKILGEYRKRAVWTGVDASQIETIAISAGTAGFALRKLGTSWIDTAKETDPIDVAKVTELLDALAGLKAERYVADQKADLKLYGLQPAQRVITLLQKGGATKTIQIGREEGGSNGKRFYARIDDKDRTDVFIISEADATKLQRDRAAYKK